MAIYKNLSGEATTTLIEKGKQISGGISKILISNTHDTSVCKVGVFFYDGTLSHYVVKGLVIPVGASVVLEDNLAFNADIYDLKITTTDSTLSVTIK
tara:strand:- start:14416 stop:14706 length:291 start_codon:yes stop_codon:yes gene_type:complete